jgi:hypothetical protein
MAGVRSVFSEGSRRILGGVLIDVVAPVAQDGEFLIQQFVGQRRVLLRRWRSESPRESR